MLGLDIAYMRIKFDHYSFSRFRDMVDAHQNLNGSHYRTTSLSGMICYPRLALTMINLSTKFEIFMFTHYEDMKSDKNIEIGGFGVVRGQSRSLKNR